MARKKRQQEWHAGELNLVAMIDVAFQLLNFFIITTHPVDVFANLDVFRPQATAKSADEQVETIEVMVYKDGVAMQRRPMGLDELDRQLARVAANSVNSMIIIKCTGDSTQAGLVGVLDLCAKNKLSKLSIFSL